MKQWWLQLREPENRLWVTPAMGAVFSICLALLSTLSRQFLHQPVLPDVTEDTLDGILDVIASSMLAVSIFSLSTMVAAFSSAANSASPRALEVVMNDDNTKLAIASFISAFIFAVIGKIALGVGLYDQNGRFFLFISTIGVLVWLIGMLIRWVDTITRLGRMGNTISKIHQSAETIVRQHYRHPDLGATGIRPVEKASHRLSHDRVCYLNYVDMAALQQIAEKHDLHIYLPKRPGALISPETIIVEIYGHCEGKVQDKIRGTLRFKTQRSFRQDPRHGIVVLGEVGVRAMSPAINDPGTAIQVMNHLAKLLIETPVKNNPPIVYDRLSFGPQHLGEFVNDGFACLLQASAGDFVVNYRAQKILALIWKEGWHPQLRSTAKEIAEQALARNQETLPLRQDFERLQQLHQKLFM